MLVWLPKLFRVQKLQRLKRKYLTLILEFNRLTKIGFDAKMEEADKTFLSKSQEDNVFNTADQREKK